MLNSPEDASSSGSETSGTSPFMTRLSPEDQVPSFNDSDSGSLRKWIEMVFFPVMIHVVTMGVTGAVLFPQVRQRSFNTESANCTQDGLAFCMAKETVHAMDMTDDLSLEPGLWLVRIAPSQQRTVGGEAEERSLSDLIETYLGGRYLRWDLGPFYPGLFMNVVPDKVGPYLSFSLDQVESTESRNIHAASKILKKTVLPFLLGFKLSLVSLVPVLIGALVILAKKSFLFTKLALLLGASGLFSGHYRSSPQHHFFQKDTVYDPERYLPVHQNVVGFERHL